MPPHAPGRPAAPKLKLPKLGFANIFQPPWVFVLVLFGMIYFRDNDPTVPSLAVVPPGRAAHSSPALPAPPPWWIRPIQSDTQVGGGSDGLPWLIIGGVAAAALERQNRRAVEADAKREEERIAQAERALQQLARQRQALARALLPIMFGGARRAPG